jgi:hypothetical protein
MNKNQTHQYSPLIDEDNECGHEQAGLQKRSSFASLLKLLCFAASTLLVLSVLWINSNRSPAKARGLPSDILFGNIPWHAIVIENDEKFIEAAPSSGNGTTVWDDIYPGTWVAFDDPSIGGASGRGMRMVDVAAEPSSWTQTSEGFGVAVMHQLHCIMTIKYALLKLERGSTISGKNSYHVHHCIETLRQAVMCQSDLTLEHPEYGGGKQMVTGWGNVHYCRDFSSVVQAVRKNSIVPGNGGLYSAKACAEAVGKCHVPGSKSSGQPTSGRRRS